MDSALHHVPISDHGWAKRLPLAGRVGAAVVLRRDQCLPGVRTTRRQAPSVDSPGAAEAARLIASTASSVMADAT